ncbi:MAG: ribose 5-phosphate isomerase B [Chlorobi bacterium]|nr:ribose 5-phosphate isomerase B [Chlorobiota bacterium]MBX7217580.1 ribose 5-phosphate isomerase B [Candidatus Kapabacteria bacterium]
MNRTIALGADHAGVNYKQEIAALLQQQGDTVLDFGTNSTESTDYPDHAAAAANAVASGQADCAILVCGSGIGVSIVANKVAGIRAANCLTAEMAQLARQHNDANVLTIGQRLVDWDTAQQIVDAFLSTPASDNERHRNRVEKIHRLTGC